MNPEKRWYRIRLSQNELFRGKLEILQRSVEEKVMIDSPSVAMFARVYFTRDSDIFVSPDAAKCLQDLLVDASAVPCRPPRRRGLSLLIGDEAASWCLVQ